MDARPAALGRAPVTGRRVLHARLHDGPYFARRRMSPWERLLNLIAAELGPEAAERVRSRAEHELVGLRFVIPRPGRPRSPTPDEVRAALARHRWRVGDAATELGIHPTTIYRIMDRARLTATTMQRAARRSPVWD